MEQEKYEYEAADVTECAMWSEMLCDLLTFSVYCAIVSPLLLLYRADRCATSSGTVPRHTNLFIYC